MRYWFENPTKPLLNSLICMISIFTIRANGALWWNVTTKKAGLVELVEINHVHRRAEFPDNYLPEYRGKGLATRAAKLAMDYGFTVLNLYKLYLIVDKENEKRFTFTASFFTVEGELMHEFFINGQYRNAIRMYIPASVSG